MEETKEYMEETIKQYGIDELIEQYMINQDAMDLVVEYIQSLKKELKETLEEISECIDGFYDDNNPKRLYPELREFAGYINVMSKVCNDALKD